jgi:hypothetical protein
MGNLIYSPYIGREVALQSKKTPITAFITLSAAMVAGTGGVLSTSGSPAHNSFGARPIIRVADWERRRLREESSSHIALITRVRAAFGMNYTQLAYSLNVSRQTVHDWMNGSQPRADVLARLWHLESLGRDLQEISAPRKRSLLVRPVTDGKDILTIMRANGDVALGIQTLLGNSLTIQANAVPSRLKKVRRISIEDVSRVLS